MLNRFINKLVPTYLLHDRSSISSFNSKFKMTSRSTKKPRLDKDCQNNFARCEWLTEDPLYITYHDNEWGVPEYDSKKLFEMLCLEGQQAGLSWITILKKRDNYRKLFHGFDPHRVSKFTDIDIERLQVDVGIVRHKGKIRAIVNNSNCFIKMENNKEDFSEFIWSFVNNKAIINNWDNIKEIPTRTAESTALSSALKKRGFKFVGPTICYAFMQACGLVNDHLAYCYCRTKQKLKS